MTADEWNKLYRAGTEVDIVDLDGAVSVEQTVSSAVVRPSGLVTVNCRSHVDGVISCRLVSSLRPWPIKGEKA